MKRLPRRVRLLRPLSIIERAALAACVLLSTSAWASPELDRLYALENVGALRSWDNVDGLFTTYVADAYKDYFSKQTRFVYQDLSKSEAVLKHTKIPYGKLIDDPQILQSIARAEKSQTLLRTKISKQGPEYRFTVDWLHSPKMDVLGTDTFILDDKEGGLGNVKEALTGSLNRIIGKLPFIANVTGRDGQSVTVNIGASSNLKKGDTLILGTIDEIKLHPLLKQIVDWRMSQTGKAEVDSVDDALAFCKLTEETEGRQVARYQKVLQLQPKPFVKEETVVNETQVEQKKQLEEPPRLGWGEAALWLGGFTREYTPATGGGKNGSAFVFGVQGQTQLWWTKEIFSELGLAYAFSNYSQTDIGTPSTPGPGSIGTTSVSSSIFNFKADVGYSYLVTGDVFGPKGWVKVGYSSTTYSFPSTAISSGDLLEPIWFRSLFVGIGADLPIRQEFGALLNLDFGILNAASEGGPAPQSEDSARDVSFFAGIYYHRTNRITFRVGVEVLANGADFSGGATLSHKLVTFAPGLVFYF
jgi:hypothetical protein